MLIVALYGFDYLTRFFSAQLSNTFGVHRVSKQKMNMSWQKYYLVCGILPFIAGNVRGSQ